MLKRSIAFVAVAFLAAVACDDAPESGRTIVSILEFNGGTPVQSDVEVNNGTDPPYIAEDIIPVTFIARAFSSQLMTGTAHNQVVIEGYHIDWTRTDGGTGNLPSRDESSNILVQVGEETDALIRLVTWADKSGPVLSPLTGGGQITMRADIRFLGREVGTEQEVEFEASTSVNFTDTVNIE